MKIVGRRANRPLSASDWQALLDKIGNALSREENAIAALLAAGKTQTVIAGQLGVYRSAVWRRARAIRTRLQAIDTPESV